jgi:hypothetical protein
MNKGGRWCRSGTRRVGQPAHLLALDRDGREEWQQEGCGDGCESETGCSRVSGGQLLLLVCGFAIPLADVVRGP